MSDEGPDDEGLEAGLRWIAEQVGRSVERLGELDVDQIAHSIGVDAERAQLFVDSASEWLNRQAESFRSETANWMGGLGAAASGRDAGPHPLDLPTEAQGLALSALDSGRWTVEPGSHVLLAQGEGPSPTDAVGLVGELRARDWIGAEGQVTLVGRNALERWIAHSNAA